MSLMPVTRNFTSVTRRVFRDRVVFSGGASLNSRRQNAFASGTQRREKRSHLPSSGIQYWRYAGKEGSRKGEKELKEGKQG